VNKFNLGDVVTVEVTTRGGGARGEYFKNMGYYEFTIHKIRNQHPNNTHVYFFGEGCGWGAYEDEIQLVNDTSKLEDFL
jgi:hypothetical protein